MFFSPSLSIKVINSPSVLLKDSTPSGSLDETLTLVYPPLIPQAYPVLMEISLQVESWLKVRFRRQFIVLVEPKLENKTLKIVIDGHLIVIRKPKETPIFACDEGIVGYQKGNIVFCHQVTTTDQPKQVKISSIVLEIERHSERKFKYEYIPDPPIELVWTPVEPTNAKT